MIWGGRWEGGSGLGTHVHLWQIHVNVWQNKYSIVKQNTIKIKIKNKEKQRYYFVNKVKKKFFFKCNPKHTSHKLICDHSKTIMFMV